MQDVLTKIAANKRLEVEALKIDQPLERLMSRLNDHALPEPGRFRKALERRDQINIIAELKKGSPSKGILAPEYDVAALAESYRDGGAAALSVLTDARHFYGGFEHLARAAEAVPDLPRLCKDFILDPYQVYLARLHGADAILLIVRLLGAADIKQLLELAAHLGMDALVEAHTEAELETALECGAQIVGVNSRNLDTFETDLATAERLSSMIPEGVTGVAESGILGRADIVRLQKCGFNSYLIGEALVTSDDPAGLLRELRGEA